MNKKGFTLMELLLVVAVLAIVAAAAAPTFFGGAQEAMDEARKASMHSAYQNTVSGANMMLSIAASKGLAAGKDTDLETTAIVGTSTMKLYAPEAARTFKSAKNTEYVFRAKMDSNGVGVIITAYKKEGTVEQTPAIDDASKLETLWTNIKDK